MTVMPEKENEMETTESESHVPTTAIPGGPTEVERWQSYAAVLRDQRDLLERALAETRAVLAARDRNP